MKSIPLRIAAMLVAATGLALLAPATPARDDSGGLRDKFGPNFRPATAAQAQPRRTRLHGDGSLNAVERWNQIAIDTSGLDHTPVAANEVRTFGHQLGPGRSARAMAIVHIAMFDAVNAIRGGYRGYTALPRAARETSIDSAVALAAHDTLKALYPSHAPRLEQLLAEDLARLRPARGRGEAHAGGIELGRQAAAAILALRSGDGAAHEEPRIGTNPATDYVPLGGPGKWRQDPISRIPLAMGAHWSQVTPFVLSSAEQFRAPQPPSLTSTEYTNAFEEVKRLGGTGATLRTQEQTQIGIFWAYDGTPSLCAPPRLYNQITTQIAAQQHTGEVELARLLALVNVAMADAGIAVWESKYFYAYARPVTAFLDADSDGSDATFTETTFVPLGAPASNLVGVNFTPPFPAYPSGHAGFGGALFQTLRNFYGTDRIGFEFVSDEFNGTTTDNAGNPRPLMPRRFKTLAQAEEENAHSRIYLGIHWSFDAIQGVAQGNKVADHVFRNAFTPVR